MKKRDIVDELKAKARAHPLAFNTTVEGHKQHVCWRAADEITQLRAERILLTLDGQGVEAKRVALAEYTAALCSRVERLERALRIIGYEPMGGPLESLREVYNAIVEIARDALRGEEEQK